MAVALATRPLKTGVCRAAGEIGVCAAGLLSAGFAAACAEDFAAWVADALPCPATPRLSGVGLAAARLPVARAGAAAGVLRVGAAPAALRAGLPRVAAVAAPRAGAAFAVLPDAGLTVPDFGVAVLPAAAFDFATTFLPAAVFAVDDLAVPCAGALLPRVAAVLRGAVCLATALPDLAAGFAADFFAGAAEDFVEVFAPRAVFATVFACRAGCAAAADGFAFAAAMCVLATPFF